MFSTVIIVVCIVAFVGATAYGVWMEHSPEKENDTKVDNAKDE